MTAAIIPVLLTGLIPATVAGQGWDARMESLDAYLLDEAYEVLLARSAAPEHIASDARVLVLRRDGYHEAVAGGNGFTCLAMSYMLSGGQLLGTNTGRFKPHIMIYVPYTTEEQIGSPSPGCEHICMFEHVGGPLSAVIVPMKKFNEVQAKRSR